MEKVYERFKGHSNLVACYILLLFILWIAFYSCRKDSSISMPDGLTITNIADTGAVVSWNKVGNATSYTVYIAKDAAFDYPAPAYGPAVFKQTSIVISSLTPGTKYFVKVIATINSDSSHPATSSFTTLDADGLVLIGSDDYNTISSPNSSSYKLYAINAKDGSIAWSYTTGASIYGSPVIQDSTIYVASSDGYVYSFRLNGALNWKWGPTLSGGTYESTPLVKNGVVYIGDLGGWLYALDASNGSLKWSAIIPSVYRTIGASAIMDDSATTIYMASFDGEVHAFNAATGTLKWSTVNTGNPIEGRPAYYNNTLYVGGFSRMYAFDAQTGATKWSTTTPAGVELYSSPAISKDKALIAGTDGNFYSINIADGSLNWMKPLSSSGSIYSSPSVVDGVIYVGAVGAVYALDENSGATLWKNDNVGTIPNAAVIYSGPTVTDNFVYAGSVYGTLYCLNKTTGALIWSTAPPGAGFQSSACVIKYSGKVYDPRVSGMVTY